MTTSVDLNNPPSLCPIKSIKAIQFGILNPDFIKRLSVCEVTNVELYDSTGESKPKGLNAAVMGPTDYRTTCGTCNMDVKECPGHWGHVNLSRPIYHCGFVATVVKILRCVCYGCSKILIDRSDARFQAAAKSAAGAHRLRRMLALCQGIKKHEGEPPPLDVLGEDEDDGDSGSCGGLQPRYFKDGPNIMVMFDTNKNERGPGDDQQEDTKRLLSAGEALDILKKISEKDMISLGFHPLTCRPQWMVLTVLPIPPPPVRPYVQFGSDRSEDDLTFKLLDIVKINMQVKRQELNGAANHVIGEMTQLLQYHITTFFDNDIPGIPVSTTRSKKPIKSIRSRLKGKEGRLRGNLMGKRVDFSARTVITGDPNLPIDEIGVPKSIAMTLTFPETVTPMNYHFLKNLVTKGPNEWPGARSIIRDDGTRYDLRHIRCTGEQQLELGYRVERHMMDGDYILFNRQPSLHKMSIMGHKVKVLPFSTFRLNLSITSPYNADFDGDEMNLHLAQTHETRAEIKHIMLVQRQIVSPQGNKPVMGIVQDSLLGLSKFTSRNCFLAKEQVMDLLLWIPYWDGRLPPPAIVRPTALWTGKQLITVLLKFDQKEGCNQIKINLQRDSATALRNDNPYCSENDSKVIIRENEHLTGIICKRTAGSSSGSLVHVMWHEAGADKTKDFLSYVQRVVNHWLAEQSFTVGCCDIIAEDSTLSEVAVTLNKSKDEVQKLVRMAQRGKLECQPGKSLVESFESQVNQELNAARETSGKQAAQSLDDTNNIIAMVNAGSKGSTINISQIIACVGQQNVEGKRIPFGFSDRTLPHFIKHDFGPESRGFVSNSYLSGLTPQELFFHAMGGREGIIDTACKTSETGYIQRRLIKAMEDVMVKYDRTVRNSLGHIVQFLYGEDGMGAEYVEDQQMELMRVDLTQLRKTYKHDFNESNRYASWIQNPKIRSDLLLDYRQQAILEGEFEQLEADKFDICTRVFSDGDSRQHLPVNIRRLIEYAKMQFPPNPKQCMTLSPVTIVNQVKNLLDNRLVLVKPTGPDDNISMEVQANATILLKAHLRTHLNSRKLMEQDKLGPDALEWLYGEIERQFHKALAHPAEVVGAIAAQSIGEPATQMTLNTFHFAGVGTKNVTLGVPRLKELINVAKTVRTPSLTVYLEERAARDQELAKDVQTQLEHTTLQKVTSYSEIFYDPQPTNTIVESDKGWVADYYEFPDEDDLPTNLGPWLLRIQLTNKVMTDKKLTMKEIGERILQEFSQNELDAIWTDDNSEELVLRIRMKQLAQDQQGGGDGGDDAAGGESQDCFLHRLMTQCLVDITLRGIKGIHKVYMREENKTSYITATGKFELSKNWVLDTDGCNLEDVLSVPSVDHTRTFSNDITEIFHVLGIEAVRRALLRELRTVISFDGSYVNYRHLAVLCDIMTQKGHLMAITRHGINRIDRGPLMKCSFEETVEILLDAAMYGEIDHLRGITENIMLGQLAPFGTGDCDILIDADRVKDQTLESFQGEMGALDDMTSPESVQVVTPDGSSTPSPLVSMLSPMPFSPTAITSPTSNITSPVSVMSPATPGRGGKFSPFAATPRSPMSPSTPFSPRGGAASAFTSPLANVFSPSSPQSPGGGGGRAGSPGYSPTSPLYSNVSPLMSPQSPSLGASSSFRRKGGGGPTPLKALPTLQRPLPILPLARRTHRVRRMSATATHPRLQPMTRPPLLLRQ
eukprot:GHVS01090880.1.p1 GENE.GHVS01090880.1~~GHVS01090880.1.p1  ORF type:complete len:1706 (-),score=216.23 GHVS01090880.1:641-5758(-)